MAFYLCPVRKSWNVHQMIRKKRGFGSNHIMIGVPAGFPARAEVHLLPPTRFRQGTLQ
jgi:hypothetical protein